MFCLIDRGAVGGCIAKFFDLEVALLVLANWRDPTGQNACTGLVLPRAGVDGGELGLEKLSAGEGGENCTPVEFMKARGAAILTSYNNLAASHLKLVHGARNMKEELFKYPN